MTPLDMLAKSVPTVVRLLNNLLDFRKLGLATQALLLGEALGARSEVLARIILEGGGSRLRRIRCSRWNPRPWG